MTIGKISTSWSGTSGGPGITQLFFDDPATFGPLDANDAQAAVNAMRTYWDAIKALLPNEIVLTVSATVDQYDPVTGELEGTATAATAPTSVTGTATAGYAMASGVRVNFPTGVIRNGRRVRGAHYIVPISSLAYSAVGNVESSTRTTINTAGAAFRAALTTAGLRLVVWSRPVDADQPNGPRVGDVAEVTGWDTSEKGAVLRGRRD